MKVRFEVKCVKCHVMMQVGTSASRAYGGIWHHKCLGDWERARGIRPDYTLVASGRRTMRT